MSKNKTLGITFFNDFTEQDYCKSRPCKNGGDCINTAVAHRCSCKNDYIGNNCDREYIIVIMYFKQNIYSLSPTHIKFIMSNVVSLGTK